MYIEERVRVFEKLFEDLQLTNSRIEKEQFIDEFLYYYPELREDWTIILETLDDKHPIGWTFQPRKGIAKLPFTNIKSIIIYCLSRDSLSQKDILPIEYNIGDILGEFIAPIVNRTLKLGIGKSLLDKTVAAPMLAKKYEGETLRNSVYVTEKLDGNRCIAHYDGKKWRFTSRNGKPMNINFDMSGLSTEFTYDGEIMNVAQTELSKRRHRALKNAKISNDIIDTIDAQRHFSQVSGLINRLGPKVGLIYTIFDIIMGKPYCERRFILNECVGSYTEDIRILPVLYQGSDTNIIHSLLDNITKMGGEGIMLNLYNRPYEQKRTDALLKYKKVKYMDMYVTDIFEGKGKYTGMCGGLFCMIHTNDDKIIKCQVGSGLSDIEREEWFYNPELILGKIVEVGYHELTQDRRNLNSKTYSLRFPRLISVREDKIDTSEY